MGSIDMEKLAEHIFLGNSKFKTYETLVDRSVLDEGTIICSLMDLYYNGIFATPPTNFRFNRIANKNTS